MSPDQEKFSGASGQHRDSSPDVILLRVSGKLPPQCKQSATLHAKSFHSDLFRGGAKATEQSNVSLRTSNRVLRYQSNNEANSDSVRTHTPNSRPFLYV